MIRKERENLPITSIAVELLAAQVHHHRPCLHHHRHHHHHHHQTHLTMIKKQGLHCQDNGTLGAKSVHCRGSGAGSRPGWRFYSHTIIIIVIIIIVIIIIIIIVFIIIIVVTIKSTKMKGCTSLFKEHCTFLFFYFLKQDSFDIFEIFTISCRFRVRTRATGAKKCYTAGWIISRIISRIISNIICRIISELCLALSAAAYLALI